MSEFNFKSQICTSREQSERLLALGLKKETADMGIIEGIEIDVIEVNWEEHSKHNSIPNFVSLPAWSLHRIMSIVYSNKPKKNGLGLAIIQYDNPFEDMIQKIEWLIKEGYFNKEYLEE